MASIKKTENGRWQATYRGPDDKERQRTFDRKVEAQTWLDTARGDIARGAYIDPLAGRQKFSAFAEEWAAAQDWKDTTREQWALVEKRLRAPIGAMQLQAIDLLALQRTRQELSVRYARATVELTMGYAGAVLRAAYAAGRIGRDPTRGFKAPRVRADEPDGHVTPDQVPTRAEALAILTAAPAPFRAAVALGLAGLRVGEVLGLSVDRLALETRLVTIDRQLQRVGGQLVMTTPKAEKSRTIVVPQAVAFELRRHLRDQRDDGLLFRGQRGALLRRDAFYSAGWHPALVGAGLASDRFVFHSLRHFCASTLLADGAPLTAVAGHLGDTIQTVSRTYLHWLRDDRDVPAAVLDRVLAPAPDEAAADG